MHRVHAGTAICALCYQSLRPDADAVVTPDFLADEADQFFPFSDATMHRACFVVWDQRKAFIAHFNRTVRRFVADDGAYLQMTSEGELELKPPPPPHVMPTGPTNSNPPVNN